MWQPSARCTAVPCSWLQMIGFRSLVLMMLFCLHLAQVNGVEEADDDDNGAWRHPNGLREWDGHVSWDDDVLVLNGRNFKMVTDSAAHILVEFYAPWCGHCQKFEPVYQRAASHLRMNGLDAILAKIDATTEPQLAREMGVAGFPSLHWFAYGEEREYEGGRRNDSLVEWVTYHARPNAVYKARSCSEAEEHLLSINATEAVIGRFMDFSSREAKAFMTVAEEDSIRVGGSTIPYVMVTENYGVGVARLPSEAGEDMPEGIAEGPAIGPSVVLRRSAEDGGGTTVYGRWFRPPNWHLNPPDLRFSLYNPTRLKAFVATYRMPAVIPLGPRYWSKVLQSPVRNQTLLFSDKGSAGHEERAAAFAMVAEEMFGRQLFLLIPSSLGNVLQYFGMSEAEFPALVVAVAGSDETDKGEMYRLDQEGEGQRLGLYGHEAGVEGAGVQGSCRADQTCSGGGAAVARMAGVVRSFTASSMAGAEQEFVLPEPDLEDDVTYPDDPVRQLTAATFDDVVLDRSRDVLVKFYAPWCGHCKAMKTAYMQLCDRLALYPSVVIAELDATRHKVPPSAGAPVEGYPTLRLYPAEREGTQHKQAPIAFTGRREVEEMQLFLSRHAVSLQLLDELKRKATRLEEELESASKDPARFDEASRIRVELEEIRRQVAGSELAVPGEAVEKNRTPVFGKRILMDALRRSKEENARQGIEPGK